MTKRRVLARFIGDHKNRGYKKGAKYSLIVRKYNFFEKLILGHNAYVVVRTNMLQPHALSSKEFNNMWQVIREF